ncbi:GspH/FimT family pseudopilin [Thermomonas sp.]|uniref:GspH/FimT family pseudopilin n=1 Tax=Thermomonas sp. TaxID=1971895 RepID=UPI00248A4BE9|nr:GspH/FimT family pseudopilin [Thermomonas sp.]MDI1252034.1 GspH/FimT family pseudopilin [Thermomonas sp.]
MGEGDFKDASGCVCLAMVFVCWITHLPPMQGNWPPIGDAWSFPATAATLVEQEYGGSMLIERQNLTGRQSHGGFTLVELMVVVAVIAILAIVAAPSMSELVSANRLNGAAGELTSAIQVARSEAIRRNARVTICPSTNGTTCANSGTWTRWIVHGFDNGATPPADEVIRDDTPTGNVQISGPAAGIVFRPSGIIDTQTTVTACLPVTRPAKNKQVVTVMISGIVSSEAQPGGGACP